MRLTIWVLIGAYILISLPLVLLFMQSANFRVVTTSEVTRKLAHVRPMRYALCGDSLTAQWPNAGSMLAGSRFAALNLGTPGAVLSQIAGQVDNAARLKPRVLAIAAGTNDRLQGRTDAEILSDFDDLLRHVKGTGLEAIVVTSIPLPRDAAHDARIGALNAELQAKVQANGWRFVDLNAAILAAPDRDALYQPDGLHFSSRMYDLWAAAMTFNNL